MSNEVEQVESDPEIDDEHNELIGEHELIECEPEIIIEDEHFDLIDQEYAGSKKTKKLAHEETKLFKCSFCDKNYGTKYSLKEHIGVMVRLQIDISTNKTTQAKEKNPYEFFKELVQKDPILKGIVDKLGAELEY